MAPMTSTQPVLHAKKRLPSGRAVLGGLLVTLAVLGVLLATEMGEDSTFQDVVVAREDLAPGTVIEPDHVEQVRMRLAEDATWVITSVEPLIGTVVLGPVGEGEFMQVSNLTRGGAGHTAVRTCRSLDRDRPESRSGDNAAR